MSTSEYENLQMFGVFGVFGATAGHGIRWRAKKYTTACRNLTHFRIVFESHFPDATLKRAV